MDSMGWALHAANILILCSFLVRDLILLRVLSIAAGVLFCMYFYPRNMFEPILWNILFSIVNLYQIALQWYNSRKIPLNQTEQFLYEHFFPTLNPIEIRALYEEAQSHKVDSNQPVEVEGLGLVVSGSVAVEQKELNAGNFMGIRPFLSKKSSRLEGQSRESLSYLCWSEHRLSKWTSQSTERHNLLLKALSHDLIKQSDQK